MIASDGVMGRREGDEETTAAESRSVTLASQNLVVSSWTHAAFSLLPHLIDHVDCWAVEMLMKKQTERLRDMYYISSWDAGCIYQ